MIRTGIVTLTTIPAIAYRVKLTAGGSGIVILSRDSEQPGIASISKTSGEAIPAANTPVSRYPQEAFAEAIALTAGMPYKKLGGVKYVDEQPKDVCEEPAEALATDAVVDSREYELVVSAYTDKTGKLSYDLINRSMIRFAHASSVARRMIAEHASVEEIRRYVTSAKLRALTCDRDLSDAQAEKILELLDEVSPKGVLKEFNEELRLQLKKAKQAK